MNGAIWRSLLWKEWREHRWKLAALVAVVVGIHVWVLLVKEPGSAHYATPFLVTLYLIVPIGSAFIAMGLASGEQSQRTASFMRSSPVDLRWLAIVKLVIGVAVTAATITIAAALTRALVAVADAFSWQSDASSLESLDSLRHLYETGGWFLTALLIGVLFSVSLMLWMAAPAVNSKSEVRAGAIGLIVVVMWWTLLAWGVYLVNRGMAPSSNQWVVIAHIAAMLPGGIWVALISLDGLAGQSYLLFPYLATHIPLAWWYITRFGHTGDRERARLNDAAPLVAPTPVWLGPARRSPLTALLWKHARECAPIVLAGAIGAGGLAVTMACLQYTNRHDAIDLLELTSGSVLVGFMTLGCCAGLVCGAGVLTSELEPRLYTFWRTRPIPIDLWFAIAFLGGLALLVVVFGVPIAIAYQFAVPEVGHEEPPLSLILAILVLSYVSGAFTASFVRNAVYASLLGLGVMAATFAGGSYALMRVVDGGRIDISAGWLSVATLAVSALLGVAAWVCVRNDWSLRLS